VIGWRPYLLTGVAIVLLAAVAFDVIGSGRNSSSCSTSDALARARQFAKARAGYAAIRVHDPGSQCAKRGMWTATESECHIADQIGKADYEEERSQLLKIAEEEPPPADGSCVWKNLDSLPRTVSTG
jgi:hypothetical protein